jgi:DNA-formamidopyrimidine glycosylase
MPEGPEVKRAANNLNMFWVGQELVEVKIHGGRYSRKPEAIEPLLDALPLKVLSIATRGKFLYWVLREQGEFNLKWLLNTFGMSGYWSSDKQKNANIQFIRSDGKSTFYHDQRNFGTFKFTSEMEDFTAKMATMGPDVLVGWVSLAEFQNLLTQKKNGQKTLAELLMNQKLISGIGNYLKAEILWMAELSPHRTPDSLTETEWKHLHSLCHIIPSESLFCERGSSIMTYRAKHQNQTLEYPHGSLAVYKRKEDPEGREVIREETKDKRTTWWVPEHQK